MSLKKLGRYDLTRVLGKGAMGLVYEGRDPNLDRRVAIKTIKVDNLSEEEAAEYEVRFRTEARSAARLQHPNIVSVYDSDRDLDIAYLVMEFIQGDDLKHHMDNGARYTLEQTVAIMTDLLSALDYAHRQNIVHRDIKPANLLIEANGRIKLTDFGVARIQEAGEATRTQGSMVGTLKYMSPEQVQGRPIDGRADLFAAGVVLYQLLTGTRPFNGDSDFDIIQNIVGQAPIAPSTLSPGLPPAVDAVVARALEKARESRFATAQEFSLALQSATRDANDALVRPPANFAPGGTASTWSETVLQRDLLMSGGSGTGTGVSASTVTQEVELVYWKDIKESNDPEEFRGFLAKFPTGIYTDLARRRLKRLNWVQDEEATLVTHQLPVETPEPVTPPAPVAPAPTPRVTNPVEPSGAEPPAVVRPSRAKRPMVWGVAAMLALAATGLGLYFGAAPVEGPVAEALPEETFLTQPVQTPAPTVAPAPADQTTPQTTVTAVVATSVPVASSTVTPTPAVVKVPPKPPAAKPPGAAPPSDTKPKTNPSETDAPKASGSPVDPVSPANAGKASHPRTACEDRWLLAFQMCMNTQCSKQEFFRHPVCVERRELEQRRRDAEQLRDPVR